MAPSREATASCNRYGWNLRQPLSGPRRSPSTPSSWYLTQFRRWQVPWTWSRVWIETTCCCWAHEAMTPNLGCMAMLDTLCPRLISVDPMFKAWTGIRKSYILIPPPAFPAKRMDRPPQSWILASNIGLPWRSSSLKTGARPLKQWKLWFLWNRSKTSTRLVLIL